MDIDFTTPLFRPDHYYYIIPEKLLSCLLSPQNSTAFSSFQLICTKTYIILNLLKKPIWGLTTGMKEENVRLFVDAMIVHRENSAGITEKLLQLIIKVSKLPDSKANV